MILNFFSSGLSILGRTFAQCCLCFSGTNLDFFLYAGIGVYLGRKNVLDWSPK